MLVLGIDPGTAICGYGFVEAAQGSRLIAHEYGAITTSPKARMQDRLVKLYDELDGQEKEKELNNTIGFMRRRNYTIWFGKCLNKWNFKDARTAEKQNFAGLFVCTAKDFLTEISNNISNCSISHGNDDSWLGQVYNRELTGRTGCLIFSIQLSDPKTGKIGYNISAQHCDGLQNLKDWTITEEEAELMKDPVESFLGWQASHEQEGRLFNSKLMKETIEDMSAQYSAVQYAKQNGGDVKEAIKNTTAAALAGQIAESMSTPVTNDPILAGQQSANNLSQQKIETMYEGNTNPYSNPPAAQIDPISQNPVAPASAPFSQPTGWSDASQSANPWGAAPSNPFGQQPQQSNPFSNPFAQR